MAAFVCCILVVLAGIHQVGKLQVYAVAMLGIDKRQLGKLANDSMELRRIEPVLGSHLYAMLD